MAHRTGRSRRALVEDAGLPTTSAVSIVAGTLVAFGALAVVAAVAGAVGNAFGVSTDGVSTSEWRSAGIVAAVVATVVVFAAFFFGG